jgi:predicted enzyme related to lactoylglutathione lyase
MKLSLIVIKTNQQEKLVAFYSLFGLEFDHHRHGNCPFHDTAKVGDAFLEIYPLPKSQTVPDITTRLGFTVEKLDELIKILKTNGIKIVSEPIQTEFGYNAIVEDPDGRKIELYG